MLKKGVGASSGIAIAKVFLLKEEKFEIQKNGQTVEEEIKLLDESLIKAKNQIENLKKVAYSKLGKDSIAIFDAHLLLLEDPALIDEAKKVIKNEMVSAAYAIDVVSKKFIELFSNMEDSYMKERAIDIKDVSQRLIKNILGIEIMNLMNISQEIILVAHDLTPSETSQLNKKFIKGFVTNVGGRTSHSAIMARNLEIPAVLGLKNITSLVKRNDTIAMDGDEGIIVVNPNSEIKKTYENKKKRLLEEKHELKKYINKKAITKDGFEFLVCGNIGNPEEAKKVLEVGGDGIGLFRSEFLYMDSQEWPDEEKQYNAYKKVLNIMKNKKVVVRTLDIGGDKHLSYFDFPKELNPFLGYRAIRLCLDKVDIFKTQLKALLRASTHGELEVDIPMIATIEEVKKVRKIIEECKQELLKQKKKFKDFKLGIMVEVPSTVEIVDLFTKHVDFFSIGTNDLIQYTFAVDRMSENITYLYQPYNPAILRKIKKVIDASNSSKGHTAVCGEMGGDIIAIPLLVGMGLHEFSMSASSILKVKKLISSLSKKECEFLLEKVLMTETNDEVEKLVLNFLSKNKLN